MVNINKLKGKMVENGMSVADLAERINLDRSTLYRKLNDGELFLIREVNAIARELNLTSSDAMDIFFSQNVA